ncbi:MAG: nucleotidyl transferase AbiEii/AbiGii toxin family protein [Thermoanaerobaculia bacterium]
MSVLTDLQNQVLRRFFAARPEFFLTGGGALVGFHLRHRQTHDLDLFTTETALDDGEQTLREIAAELALELKPMRRSPDFRRFLLSGAVESVVVDLVRDVAPQLFKKVVIGGIVVDPPEDPIPSDESLLHGMTRAELVRYRDLLVQRLTAAAFPGPLR